MGLFYVKMSRCSRRIARSDAYLVSQGTVADLTIRSEHRKV